MFKLSIRDDNSIMHYPDSRRGKSLTERAGDKFTESSSRYLQRHLAQRYEPTSDDEETGRRPRTSRSQKQEKSKGLGDPWKISRSRDRRRDESDERIK